MGMDPITIGAGVGAVSNIIGGINADREQRVAMEDAARLRGNARSILAGVELPDIEKEKLDAEMLQYLGSLSPEQLETIKLGPTAAEQINVDPSLRQKQMEALERVGQLSKEGMTPEEKSILEMTRRRAAAETQAKMSQIMQDRQQRGIAGGGDELAMKLAAAQQGADMQSQQDMQAAQQMMNTRRQALRDLADMSGNVRQQEYGEQSDLAKARDVISQFNARNAQDVASQNVAAKNKALERNLETQQKIANQNVELRNAQQEYNKKLLDKDYQRRMGRAQAAAGMQMNEAGARMQEGQITSGLAASQGQMIGGLASGIGSSIQGQRNTDKLLNILKG